MLDFNLESCRGLRVFGGRLSSVLFLILPAETSMVGKAKNAKKKQSDPEDLVFGRLFVCRSLGCPIPKTAMKPTSS